MERDERSGSDPITGNGSSSLVFVYGTLLSGQRNHAYLCGAAGLGSVYTEPHYRLVDLGSYPALRNSGDDAIRGELYLVSPEILAALDRLEGHPHFYRRGLVTLDDGRLASTYFLPEDQYENAAQISCWPPEPSLRRC
jgi:gamma-glutamylcyclotransferase (GGCT)/AIG2-like uncharacterized protein YtfP